MGEPSEREALLTILLEYACKEVLRSYLTLGCERTYIASLRLAIFIVPSYCLSMYIRM
jgi:hypothetical protein